MRRAYFFWDYDLSEEDVREILAGDDVHRKAWVISRILNAARWEDIWKYVTVEDIRTHFDQLRFRFPYLRELWAHALEVWTGEPGSKGAGGQGRRGAEVSSDPTQDRRGREEVVGQAVREAEGVYQMEPAPELHPGILTPLQEAFLTRFFAYHVGGQFFLTGGTALAAFYLYHRLSEDVDLFTLEDGDLNAAQDAVLAMGDEMGWEADVRRLSPHFLQAVLTAADGESLKAEFVQDVGPQFGEKQWCEGIIVDSLVNIAANIVTAILGRGDAKDFVDLYFIVHQLGYDLDELLQMARQKDLGLTAFYLAGMLRQIHAVKDLPIMLKPVDLETLIPFYDELAHRLLARHGPVG